MTRGNINRICFHMIKVEVLAPSYLFLISVSHSFQTQLMCVSFLRNKYNRISTSSFFKEDYMTALSGS